MCFRENPAGVWESSLGYTWKPKREGNPGRSHRGQLELGPAGDQGCRQTSEQVLVLCPVSHLWGAVYLPDPELAGSPGKGRPDSLRAALCGGDPRAGS